MLKFFKRHTWVIVAIMGIVLFPQSLSFQSKIDARVLITGVAIDKAAEGFEVTAQAVMPTGATSGQSGPKAVLEFISKKAGTIYEGLEVVASEIGKVPGLAHLNFIMLGESVLEEDIQKCLDFAIRRGIIDTTVLILACEGPAKRVIQETQHLDLGVAISLRRHFFQKRNAGNGVISVAQDFVNNQYNLSRSVVLPFIDIFVEKTFEEMEGEEAAKADEFQKQHARIAYINKSALYKDSKKCGMFETEEEIMGYIFAQGKSKEILLNVENINDEIYNDARVCLRFRNKKVRVVPGFKNGKPTFKLEISLKKYDVREIEQNDSSREIYKNLKSFLTKAVKDAVKKKVEGAVTASFEKARAEGADVFNVANQLNRKKNKEWKKYSKTHSLEDLLNEVEFSVECKVENVE